MGIRYIVDDATTFDLRKQFDIVTPTYLLHYAETEEQLVAFARGIARHLKTGGRMVALHASNDPVVPFLPNAQSSSEWASALLTGEQPKEGAQINLHLYDVNGKEVCPVIVYYYWTKQTYSRHLFSAGLVDPEWIKVEMPEEARRALSNWRDLDRLSTSCVLTAVKI
jgi:SAM-dependent methyltransferase